MMRHDMRKSASGFTLIELLLGSVISAVLLAALYEVFHSLLFMQALSNDRLESAVPRAHVIATIKADLENMAVPNSLLCGSVIGQTEGETDQRSDRLEFSTTSGKLTDALPWGEIQKVEYYLAPPDDQENSSELQLVRTATRNLLATTIEELPEPAVMLENVNSLEIQYFDGQVWSDSWDSTVTESTPKAVRVRILFRSADVKRPDTEPIEIVCEVAAQNASTL